jgi:cell division protein FtsB
VKLLALFLLLLLVWLQYKVWLQDGGIPEVIELQDEVESVKNEVDILQERNSSLDAEVKDLKKGFDAIEERARSEMGMIKKGETYYQVIEPKDVYSVPSRPLPLDH